MMKDLIIYLVLSVLCFGLLGCLNAKDAAADIVPKIEKESIEVKRGFFDRWLIPWHWFSPKKRVPKPKADPEDPKPEVQSPRAQLEDDFSLFKYLFLLIGIVAAGITGFGAWLKDKDMVKAGLVMFLLALAGPIAIYVFKAVAIIIVWTLGAIIACLGAWFLFSVIKYIKEGHADFETVVESLDLVVEHGWQDGKSKVAKIQDKKLQNKVDVIQDKIATQNATKTRKQNGD